MQKLNSNPSTSEYDPEMARVFHRDPPPDNLPHNTPAGKRKPAKPPKPVPGDHETWDKIMDIYHEMLFGK